jgi:hypothetical protein
MWTAFLLPCSLLGTAYNSTMKASSFGLRQVVSNCGLQGPGVPRVPLGLGQEKEIGLLRVGGSRLPFH